MPDASSIVEQFGPIVIATCCREWPVFFRVPVRRCGLCKTKPVISTAERDRAFSKLS